jgi:hypothetical protein
MSAERQYLLGRVGPYGVFIPAESISAVWVSGEAPRVEWTGALAIDLRSLFSLKGSQQSAQVALRGEGAFARVIVLDAISELRAVKDKAFIPLPNAFRYARGMFDALCTTPVAGIHALRLHREPNFIPMLDKA